MGKPYAKFKHSKDDVFIERTVIDFSIKNRRNGILKKTNSWIQKKLILKHVSLSLLACDATQGSIGQNESNLTFSKCWHCSKILKDTLHKLFIAVFFSCDFMLSNMASNKTKPYNKIEHNEWAVAFFLSAL